MRGLSAAVLVTVMALVATGAGTARPAHAQCAQWNISGTWVTSQGNNYHVTFRFSQNKTVIGGVSSLSRKEQAAATYTTPTSKIVGTLKGSHLVVKIRYTKTSGVTLTGLYIGTITHGSLKGTGRDITTPGATAVAWSGKGPTRCVR
ncbi:MAG: hypothetical protein H0X39_13445 [Actinobacteria bacterium]|nr:hypothetical protein [Actinomycetota bacterium]